MFNTYARLLNGDPAYTTGVIAPTAGVGIVGSGGGAAAVVTRAYLITYENIYGEESGPSPPVTGATYADATWTIYFPAPPAIPGDLRADEQDQRLPHDHVGVWRRDLLQGGDRAMGHGPASPMSARPTPTRGSPISLQLETTELLPAARRPAGHHRHAERLPHRVGRLRRLLQRALPAARMAGGVHHVD